MSIKTVHIILVQSLSLLLLFVGLSCASKVSKPPSSSMSRSAEREAAQSLIQEGERALQAGRYDQAQDRFQEAVRLEPTYGVGYYYLALVKLRTGEYGEVGNLLEKAENLLSSDPDWDEWSLKIEELKRELVR